MDTKRAIHCAVRELWIKLRAKPNLHSHIQLIYNNYYPHETSKVTYLIPHYITMNMIPERGYKLQIPRGYLLFTEEGIPSSTACLPIIAFFVLLAIGANSTTLSLNHMLPTLPLQSSPAFTSLSAEHQSSKAHNPEHTPPDPLV